MGVVFAFGARPGLSAGEAGLLAVWLDGLQTRAGEALARRLRAGMRGDGEPVKVSIDELESLVAVLADVPLAHQERALSELRAEAIVEFVGRPH